MTMTRLLFCASVLLVLAEPVYAQSTEPARARFIDAKGQAIGTATLTEMPGGILISLEVSGLPAGEHGFHVHEAGKCEPDTGFESAGEHFDPRGHKHGYSVEDGPHAGDMPNQFVGADGRLRAHVFNPGVALASGDATLFDQNGSTIIIHANPDDYRGQPSGNAGARIACAVVEK
jgi:Cu-Zn family superoxide dismutase